MTKKYAIENNSGQWWTGSCWGVIQNRQEYDRDDLPSEIDFDNFTDDKIISFEDAGVKYYHENSSDEDAADAVAVAIS